jgi:hypothetical protein
MPIDRHCAYKTADFGGSQLTDIGKIATVKNLIMAELGRLGLTDFEVENGGDETLLISRDGHVHATWTILAGRLSYTLAGYGAPTFTTINDDSAVKHTLRMLDQTRST